MLGEDDVVMTDAEAPGAQAETCPAPAKNEQSHSSPAASNVSLRETIESSIGSPGFSSDYTALSPSDIALLDGPDPQPSNSDIQIPKVEENPFSPSLPEMDVDTEMFPALPSSKTPIVPKTTAPLPNGPVKINGVYYQLVPTPHNIVVATSTVSDPTLMALKTHKMHLLSRKSPKSGLNSPCPNNHLPKRLAEGHAPAQGLHPGTGPRLNFHMSSRLTCHLSLDAAAVEEGPRCPLLLLRYQPLTLIC